MHALDPIHVLNLYMNKHFFVLFFYELINNDVMDLQHAQIIQ